MLKDIKYADAEVQVVDAVLDTQLIDANKELQRQLKVAEADINRGLEMMKRGDEMLERANKEKGNFMRQLLETKPIIEELKNEIEIVERQVVDK